MKANELRIGNMVSNGTKEYMVDSNMIYDIQFMKANFDPIPLTEEWLLKFGFEKHDIHNYYFGSIGEYEIRISINVFSGILTKESSWFISIQTGYGSQPYTLIKKYVHELQNLYFALTGEELTMKKSCN